jgi:hypothetical protein
MQYDGAAGKRLQITDMLLDTLRQTGAGDLFPSLACTSLGCRITEKCLCCTRDRLRESTDSR